jgi:hypothetical protein
MTSSVLSYTSTHLDGDKMIDPTSNFCQLRVLVQYLTDTSYHMSMMENLEFIKKYGMERFLEKEIAKWHCPKCGGVICCHNGLCFDCSLDGLRQKKQKYRWEDK